jgi:hypothetical protein
MKRVITPNSDVIRAERKKLAIGADRRFVRSGRLEGDGTAKSQPRNRGLVRAEMAIGLATRRESSNVCVYGED